MEALNAKSDRFDELSAEEVDQIISQSASKRTQQCTNWGVAVFNDWLQTRYPEERLEYLDAETLAERLKRFYQEVKKSPTENYSASTHICIRSAIDRHLTDHSEACKISIIKGIPFIRANKSLRAKLKLLRTEGVGQINRAYSILAEDLQKCYETGVFGDHCPYSLLRVNWFNLTLHFPYRGRQSQRKILKDSFEIRRDNNGVEFVAMVSPSSGNMYNTNDIENRMFSSGTERCPVRLFKKLLSVLNPRLDALFQAPAKNFKPEDTVWFQAIPIGVNRLSSMMREISKDACLSRAYNNNCIRATTVTVLDYAGKLVQQINNKAISKKPRLAPKITNTSIKPISTQPSTSAPTMVTPPITSNILLLKRVENEQSGMKTNNLVLLQPVNVETVQSNQASMATFTLNSLTGPTHTIKLDGCNLTTQELVQLSKGATKIEISDDALFHVQEARDVIDDIVDEHKVVYGVTTGFGKFAQTVIEPGKLGELQENLIRSHAAGVGDPLSPSRTRMVMALRINVLAKGYSGISVETLKKIVAAFNASCLPWIPEQGTVGASGDLAPLSHLALGLMGEGKMWSPKSGWADAKQVLEAHDLTPISLGPKEGLAMINGTQLITALGVEALERCKAIARQADVIAALSLECLKGTTRAFDSRIHKIRPHKGQSIVAQRFRSLLNSIIYPSAISESHVMCDKVQDPYTLRCCPQVHGIVLDTIEFVQGILNTEMNSATDNPMVFAEFEETLSGGNFHGEYPAKALDYLAIGIHELCSISERRTNRLVDPAYSGLPAFLVEDGGLNSGFMVAHCTAASLVSENKVFCHPSSVDSLSTSAGTEDHVSMGGWSARKVLKVVENVERVLAIELLAACQGINLLRPLTTTKPLEAVHSLVRMHIKSWDKDRYMKPDIDKATELLKEEKIWEAVEPFFTTYMSTSFETDLSGHHALAPQDTSS